ncbi:clarin-2-like isoform X2 [Mizuhopecten yessoensis]|uniref:clarin-2-like isoform X2 n=1 Tax=Mizuhopecten yessoensis TaxID=6573 RepID=UPI000B45C01F|nr:clarin-2-like isoform X2 [Mizuhopecten yessoensis]
MGETKKVFIGLTIYVSLAAIGLVVAAFVTEHWISAFAQKKNNTLSRNASETVGKFTGNITFGLFAGTRKVNYGVGAREQTIEVKKELYEFGLFPYGLWVATIVLSALGMAWGLVSIGFSIFNIAGKPIETITGPMGLYLWNGLALLFTALGMVMYLVLYFRYYQYNVLPLEDRLADYTTENNTDLDYSFYLLVAATGLYFINLLFLIFSGAKLKCGFTREADKVIDNGIILY